MSKESIPATEILPKGYVIAQLEITNEDMFYNEYGSRTFPTVIENEGKILVTTQPSDKLEGEWIGNWTVIIEFPSKVGALDWYNSKAYQDAMPYRKNATAFSNLVVLDGFTPPQN